MSRTTSPASGGGEHVIIIFVSSDHLAAWITHVRVGSFSQAILDERHSGSVHRISCMVTEPRHGRGGAARQLSGHVLSVL